MQAQDSQAETEVEALKETPGKWITIVDLKMEAVEVKELATRGDSKEPESFKNE